MRFCPLSVNGDGVLSFDEFCSMWEARSGPAATFEPSATAAVTVADAPPPPVPGWERLHLPPELGPLAGFAPAGASCSSDGIVTSAEFVCHVALAEGDLFPVIIPL